MSFHSFKETLKPCTNPPSSSSDLTSSYSQPSISHQFDLPTNSRKPPKSSLSQQLLRLQDPLFVPQIQSQSQQDQTPAEDRGGGEDVDEDEEKPGGFGRPMLDSFQFDQTGPFEPLVLSSPGVNPVIQVIVSRPISCYRFFVSYMTHVIKLWG
ncbi:hypothetical protein U1Q18_001563 [Sarracenia purpurea var. burkii]